IRDMIIDGEKIGEIKDFIEEGKETYGMQTFDQCLADLVNEGAVTFEVAKMNSSNPSDFELKMTMFSSTGAPKKMEAVAEVVAATEAGGADAGMLEGIQT